MLPSPSLPPPLSLPITNNRQSVVYSPRSRSSGLNTTVLGPSLAVPSTRENALHMMAGRQRYQTEYPYLALMYHQAHHLNQANSKLIYLWLFCWLLMIVSLCWGLSRCCACQWVSCTVSCTLYSHVLYSHMWTECRCGSSGTTQSLLNLHPVWTGMWKLTLGPSKKTNISSV